MPEIAGDAAVYFDHYDPDDIARALNTLLSDPDLRSWLREQARVQAQHFPDAAEVARRTLAVIEEAGHISG